MRVWVQGEARYTPRYAGMRLCAHAYTYVRRAMRTRTRGARKYTCACTYTRGKEKEGKRAACWTSPARPNNATSCAPGGRRGGTGGNSLPGENQAQTKKPAQGGHSDVPGRRLLRGLPRFAAFLERFKVGAILCTRLHDPHEDGRDNATLNGLACLADAEQDQHARPTAERNNEGCDDAQENEAHHFDTPRDR